jgi:hypothetical protein
MSLPNPFLFLSPFVVAAAAALWWVFYRMERPPPMPGAGVPLPTGPMSAEDIGRIAGDLGVALPGAYGIFLASSRGDIDGESVLRDAQLIIEATQHQRSDQSGSQPWPPHFIYLGDEADACPYALDCQTGEVLRTDKGKLDREPLERYASFELFLEHFKR